MNNNNHDNNNNNNNTTTTTTTTTQFFVWTQRVTTVSDRHSMSNTASWGSE